MNSKTDELDYIVEVQKKAHSNKKITKSVEPVINNNAKPEKANNINFNENKNIDTKNNPIYKIGPKKIHKNITLDEDVVHGVYDKQKKYGFNFSEAINIMLRYAIENDK